MIHFYAPLLAGIVLKWYERWLVIGNDSVPIQLAQCWFPGLAISNARI